MSYRQRQLLRAEKSVARAHALAADTLCIFTDGSCANGMGSWAFAVVRHDNVISENAGAVQDTTNNRMELQAVLQALAHVRHMREPHTVFTDSRYVLSAASKRHTGGPRPSDPNGDLIRQLYSVLRMHAYPVSFHWIKGHAGHQWNEYVDQLAEKAREEFCKHFA
jgi:ribonuclease HI